MRCQCHLIFSALVLAFLSGAAAYGETLISFDPPSQTFTGDIQVKVKSNPASAIYYTVDGSKPDNKSKRYEGPISVSKTTMVRVVAIQETEEVARASSAYVQISDELRKHKSSLPIMVVEGFGKPIPGKGWNQMGIGIKQVERLPVAWMLLEKDQKSGVASFESTPALTARAGIRRRGSFSSTWKEKPYSLEVWDEEDEDLSVKPLGMPKESDWVLYYPDPSAKKDRTLIYNAFMWRLSATTGRYAPRFRWVEAFVNEDGGPLEPKDRRGLYAIVEKVKRDSDRINFEKMSEDGTTGGWLLSINRMDPEPAGGFPAPNGAKSPQFFHTAGRDRKLDTAPNSTSRGDDIPQLGRAQLNFENPSGYKINPAQRARIEGWFKEFEDVLWDDTKWLDPESGYRKYIDAQDFIDFFIFNNLAQNYDGLLLSIYPWMSSEDAKLRMGPTWDFNWDCYNQSGSYARTTMSQRGRLWYGRLFEDPGFLQEYFSRWSELRTSWLSDKAMSKVISDLAGEIGEDVAIAQGIKSASEWKNRLGRMEKWLRQRAKWIDQSVPGEPQFSTTSPKIGEDFFILPGGDKGRVYFTIDGSDPMNATGRPSEKAKMASRFSSHSILRSKAPARAFVPKGNSLGASWVKSDFDDSDWISGRTGMGYDEDSDYNSRIGSI